jgi:hypothetical protein
LAAWDNGETCQECFKEALSTEPNPIKRARMVEKLPCPKHGHPAHINTRLQAWVDFYNVVAPYSTSPTTLDHVLISKLCLDHGLNFSEAFEMLTTIHKAVSEHANKGDQKSDT